MTSTYSTRGVPAVIVSIALACAAGLAVALGPAGAAHAGGFGTDIETIVPVRPGETARAPATLQVGDAFPSFDRLTITFDAPATTTFAAQTSVPTQASVDGRTYTASTLTVDGCVVGPGGTTLTCHGPTATSAWDAQSYHRFLPLVTVNATAPKNRQLASNNALSLVQSGVPYNANMTLKIKTPAAIAVAVAGAPGDAVAATATPAISGTGDEGAVVTVVTGTGTGTGTGTPYCTATVAVGGAWSCTSRTALPDGTTTFVARQRNTDGSVTTAQTTRTIATVAATPVLAPAGLLAAACIGLGTGVTTLVRRRVRRARA